MPEAYGVQNFRRESLPILLESFQLTPREVKAEKGYKADPGALKQLKVIKEVFSHADKIICATDAGREGELIFRYIYQFIGCNKPFVRLWISSLTDKAIREGLQNLKDGSLFDNLFRSAQTRSEADWMIGINASQALSVAAGQGTFSLGRVQSPTLAMICKRFLENKNFVPQKYWQLKLQAAKDDVSFAALSADKYDTQQTAIDMLQRIKEAATVQMKSVERKEVNQEPPFPYDLTELRKDANRYYGMTAGKSLDIAQRLYEKKLISYPRTSSRFLPEDVYETLPAIMEKILNRKELRPYARTMGINIFNLPKGVVDTDRVTEHHAIILTDMRPEGLEQEEMQLYLMIVGRMLEVFMPACKVEYITVDAICAARKFQCRVYRIVEKGWFGIFERENLIAGNGYRSILLPELSTGETVTLAGCNLVHRKDLPVSAYTDAELIEYMDTAGLGTVATRTHILQTLIDRKYIRYAGKYIIPTRKGLYLYETVRGMKIAGAALTSGWEAQLARMEQGKLSQEEFLDGVLELAGEVTEEIFNTCRPKNVTP